MESMDKIICPDCGWSGAPSDLGGSSICPGCGKEIVHREEAEDLVDVEGGDHLALRHGDRFRSWYLFRTERGRETLPTGFGDVMYGFPMVRTEAIFIMSPKIEFGGGIISYSNAERELGIFRFPRRSDGMFTTPVTYDGDTLEKELNSLDEKGVERLLGAPPPLVFEAFRIPRFGFEDIDISPADIQAVEDLTSSSHAGEISRAALDRRERMEAVLLDRIRALPDYLLILENTLDRRRDDLEKVASETGGIIHI